MRIVDIHDLSDPRLDPYRQLAQSNLTRHSGRFIAESPLLVERLLASGLQTESILTARRYCSQLEAWPVGDVPVYVVPDHAVSEVVGFQFHRGVLACAHRPRNPSLAELVAPRDAAGILVICPQIVDPTNLASVVRNTSALGGDGLLLGPHAADPFSRRVARVSMGTLFRLPIRVADNLAEDLTALAADHGYTRVATVLDPAATPLPLAQRPPRLALLFGSEGHGLDEETLRLCDRRVTLAMHRDTDSLNVGSSTGIFLYHYACLAPGPLDTEPPDRLTA